ncbi:MAG: FkbM family methyltransferase [Brumimicrobium sp.]
MVKKIKKKLFNILINHPRLFDVINNFRKQFKKPSEEQVFLKEVFYNLKAPIKLIQIGANDGLRSDPVREYILKYNCNVILIEADPINFSSLKKNYKHVNRNIKFLNRGVVHKEDESVSFYSFSEQGRKIISKEKQVQIARKASFDRAKFENHLKELGYTDAHALVSKQNIETISLNELFQNEFIPDIIFTDTEGLDWALINSIDFSSFKPKVIFFESKFNPKNTSKEAVFKKLKNAGYVIHEFQFNCCCVLKN